MPYILIVDDDVDFAAAVTRILGDAGYEVATETDTGDALERIRRRRPDLLILDVIFPEDSSAGFALARTLQRESDTLGSIPVLLLTAINATFPLGFSSRDIDELWLPVSDFLEKPVDCRTILTRAELLLDKAASGADNELPPAERQD